MPIRSSLHVSGWDLLVTLVSSTASIALFVQNSWSYIWKTNVTETVQPVLESAVFIALGLLGASLLTCQASFPSRCRIFIARSVLGRESTFKPVSIYRKRFVINIGNSSHPTKPEAKRGTGLPALFKWVFVTWAGSEWEYAFQLLRERNKKSNSTIPIPRSMDAVSAVCDTFQGPLELRVWNSISGWLL